MLKRALGRRPATSDPDAFRAQRVLVVTTESNCIVLQPCRGPAVVQRCGQCCEAPASHRAAARAGITGHASRAASVNSRIRYRSRVSAQTLQRSGRRVKRRHSRLLASMLSSGRCEDRSKLSDELTLCAEPRLGNHVAEPRRPAVWDAGTGEGAEGSRSPRRAGNAASDRRSRGEPGCARC